MYGGGGCSGVWVVALSSITRGEHGVIVSGSERDQVTVCLHLLTDGVGGRGALNK